MEHQFWIDVVCASLILTGDEKINNLRQHLDAREKKRASKQSILLYTYFGRRWFAKNRGYNEMFRTILFVFISTGKSSTIQCLIDFFSSWNTLENI